MRVITVTTILATGLIGAVGVSAQGGKIADRDPVRAKYADQRQYRAEPEGNQSKRNTRCKIIVQKGQDKRICGVPTNISPGDGRKQ